MIYKQAKTFGQLPSDLLGFEHAWVRWQFDNAVFHFGSRVDNKLNQYDENGKPKYTPEQALNLLPKPVKLADFINRRGARVKVVPHSEKQAE